MSDDRLGHTTSRRKVAGWIDSEIEYTAQEKRTHTHLWYLPEVPGRSVEIDTSQPITILSLLHIERQHLHFGYGVVFLVLDSTSLPILDHSVFHMLGAQLSS